MRLNLQQLNDRCTPAAGLFRGTLHIDAIGDFANQSYEVSVERVGRTIVVTEHASNGVVPDVVSTFSAARTHRLEISGASLFSNIITNDTKLPAIIIGGLGVDQLTTQGRVALFLTGGGADEIHAPNGRRLTFINDAGDAVDVAYVSAKATFNVIGNVKVKLNVFG